jgi:hypothetical protein
VAYAAVPPLPPATLAAPTALPGKSLRFAPAGPAGRVLGSNSNASILGPAPLALSLACGLTLYQTDTVLLPIRRATPAPVTHMHHTPCILVWLVSVWLCMRFACAL